MIIETCNICCGRGGLGQSFNGVTLSYRTCNYCEGSGVIEIPENSQDELELKQRWEDGWLM
ncbi:conserved hypothetical protein [Vibrio phage 249E41-1]|nr:conserved hypothetical protein [Vibrio phage 249E41-1]CAH9017172.1 conserved hypothetical protein [Vibrio phage 193E37-1]